MGLNAAEYESPENWDKEVLMGLIIPKTVVMWAHGPLPGAAGVLTSRRSRQLFGRRGEAGALDDGGVPARRRAGSASPDAPAEPDHPPREPDGAARHDRGTAHLLLGLGEVGEELDRSLVERPPALGQAHAAGGPVQQARLEMRFQLGDVPGRRRRREPQLLCGARKAAGFDDL